MIKYRIHRPFSAMAHGQYPIDEAWHTIGLGHLLPLQLTGHWPVYADDGQFVTGPKGPPPSTWHPISNDLEIGLSLPFDPTCLSRPEILPGIKMTDRNNWDWIVPNANPQSPACSVPKECTWAIGGPTQVHDPKYRDLMDRCCELFEEIIEAPTLNKDWTALKCLEILQVNYRIGLPELAALEANGVKIIDNNFAAQVVLWFVDFDLLEDVAKKKEVDSLTCS